MMRDDENDWFDRIVRQAGLPAPSPGLCDQILARAGRPVPAFTIENRPLREAALFATAAIGIFCFGIAAHGWLYDGAESLSAGLPYYAGPGLYIVENFLS